MATWACTARIADAETTQTLEADDLVAATAACIEWASDNEGEFIGVRMIDTARESGIAKLIAGLPLTPEEAMAVAGG